MLTSMKRLLALLLLFALLAPVPVKANASDPWASAYANWQYRREVTISNPNANNLTDFQVKITLNSTNFDFSKANADGSDIRFTADDGETLLPYWIEKWDSTSEEAVIWVKVPSIPANGQVTIYMYYGNSEAVSESDPESVFEFFDDFSTDPTGRYTEYGGTGVFSWDSENERLKGDAGTADTNYYYVNDSFTFVDGVIEMDIVTGASGGVTFRFTDLSNLYAVYVTDETYPDTSYRNKIWIYKKVEGTGSVVAGLTRITNPASSQHKLKVVVSGQTASLWWDDNLIFDNINLESGNAQGRIGVRIYRGTGYWDNIRVRKYAEQEPTASVSATEEIFNPAFVTFYFYDDLNNTLNQVNLTIDGQFYGTIDSGNSVPVAKDNHTFLAQKEHYLGAQLTMTIDDNMTVNMTLNRKSYVVYFYAYDENNDTLSNFTVYANDTLLGTFDSGDNATIKYGTYEFRFKKPLYQGTTVVKTIDANGTVVNFTNVKRYESSVILYFYDTSTDAELNHVDVVVKDENSTVIHDTYDSGSTIGLTSGNYTFTFSKMDYESRTITLEVVGNTTISVYLEPSVTTVENGTIISQPTETPTTPTQAFFNYTNDYGFFGFRLGDKLMRFQIDEVIPEFFNLTPIFAIFIPLIMTLSIGIAAWYYSRNSLVVLGVLAIMNTFFFLLGLKVELSMFGPLTALVIFFVAWIFWDLYKSKERV